MPDAIPHLMRLRDIIERYDAIISDVWGVVHNGITATPGAHEALATARKAGRAVTLLTNAPRTPASVQEQLRQMDIPDHAYDAIVSSGGVSRALIAAEGTRPFYYIGPKRDEKLFAGLGGRPTVLAEAEYILCTGLVDDESESPEQYRPTLEAAFARSLKFYCANPDLIVERGSRLIPCAGALADIYEKLGGKVVWVGKPHPLVYDTARAEIARVLGREVPRSRILCIGDAFRTDIAGAVASGHDCLMTLAGIHAHQIGLAGQDYDRMAFEALAEESSARPTMTMVSLTW